MTGVEASLSAHLKRWANELRAISDTPRLDAEILFKYASGFNDTQLIAEGEQPLEPRVMLDVEAQIDARHSGVPVAYITGSREFYSLPLKVNPQVLIPRPDTECLVEAAIECIKKQSAQRVLDMGTGSGAIALALARQLPELQVTATDRDNKALDVAKQNARCLKINNVRFVRSDWFQNLAGAQFDMIVSNPPYIDSLDEHLRKGDVRFEPRTALVSEEHGLADLRAIINGAGRHLIPGGYLFLEHGYDQAFAVTSMLLENGFTAVETRKDFGQNDRLSLGRF